MSDHSKICNADCVDEDIDNATAFDSIPEDKDSLETIIDTLSLNDRSTLYDQLRNIFCNGHMYHHQWQALGSTHPHILDTSFEILRKFESNGLQLHGYGCWFFEQVIVSVQQPLHSSQNMTEEQMLEMILRVLLEHNSFLSCVQIISKLCSDELKYFNNICEIGE